MVDERLAVAQLTALTYLGDVEWAYVGHKPVTARMARFLVGRGLAEWCGTDGVRISVDGRAVLAVSERRVRSLKGLHEKYLIERTDGSSMPGAKHEHCDYFVLDLVHDVHAVAALAAYASACERKLPELARDLRKRFGICPDCAGHGSVRVPTKSKKHRKTFGAFMPARCPCIDALEASVARASKPEGAGT